jgi:Subtilase family/Secretion system C-terminal sorting domain
MYNKTIKVVNITPPQCKQLNTIKFTNLFFNVKTPLMLFFLMLVGASVWGQTTHPLKLIEKTICFKLKPNTAAKVPLTGQAGIDIKLDSIFTLYQVQTATKLGSGPHTPRLNLIYEITFADNSVANQLVAALKALPTVEYAERIPVSTPLYTPNDPSVGNARDYHLRGIRAYEAFDIFPPNPANQNHAKIAIIDVAVKSSHPDLGPNMAVGALITSSSNVQTGLPTLCDPPSFSNPLWNHGTNVAGIAGAATNNGIGVASIGWSNKIYGVRTSDVSPGDLRGSHRAISAMLALNIFSRPDIINCSFASYYGYETEYQAIQDLYDNNIIMVAGAGNDDNGTIRYPAAYGNGFSHPAYNDNQGNQTSAFTEDPANKNLVIAVGAIDASKNRAQWISGAFQSGSNFGPWVDVSAYGTNIYTTSFDNLGNSTYANFNGTSASAPMVAGLLGLMKSYKPNASRDQLITCLLQNTTDIYTNNPSNQPNTLGTGLINAEAAMRCMKDDCTGVNPIAYIHSDKSTVCGTLTAILSSSGGTAYAWSTGATATTAGNATVSQPGIYTVTVTYQGGCTATNSVTLNAPTLTVPEAYACFQGQQATLTAFGPAGNYVWSTGETGQSISPYIFTPYEVYAVTVTYTCGSTTTYTASTTAVASAGNGSPYVIIRDPGTVCEGSLMHLTLLSSAGPNAVYNWGGFPSEHSNTLDVIAPSAGLHTYVVSVSDGCGSASATRQIYINPAPSASPTVITANDGTFPQTLDAGTTGAGIWKFNGAVIGSTQNSMTIDVYEPGIYYIEVSNGGPCPSVTSAVVVYGCGFPNPNPPSSALTLTGSHIITTSMYSDRDIIINGVTEFNNCTLTMAEGKRIFVKQSSALTLNNATITACEGYWLGIAVDGYTNGDLGAYNLQGKVFMSNNSKIEYAIDAIITYRDQWTYTSGVVQATNSTFRNNMRDVGFMKARHKSAGGSAIRNPSFFTQCTFLSDNNFGNAAHPFPVGVANMPHITMWDVHGVKIEDCIFQSDLLANNAARYGETGIHSDGATYTATGNTFEGMYYGISAFNAEIPLLDPNVPTSSHLFLQNNTFGNANTAQTKQTQRGIYLSAGSGFVVDGNHFYADNRSDNNTLNGHWYVDDNNNLASRDAGSYSLYLDGCAGWKGIENNEFNNQHTGLSSSGIVFNNSATDSKIQKNTFNDLAFATASIGSNRVNVDIGIQIRCNTFNNNINDISVMNGDGLPNQGSPASATSPACNTFAPFGKLVNILTDNSIQTTNYYYHSSEAATMLPKVNPDVAPQAAGEVNPQGVTGAYNIGLACPDHTFNPPTIITTTDPTIINAAAWQTRSDAMITRGILKNQLTQLEDGGNTDLLSNEVATAQLQAAWTLYTTLMQKSPYLSEEVLLELAEKENFPAVLIKNIMLANQHAAKSVEIIAKLEERSNALPDYMLDLIKNSGTASSAKETLERAIATQESRLTEAVNQQLNALYDSETATNADFITVLQGVPVANYRLQYAEKLIANGEYTAAQSVIDNLVTDCDLDKYQALRYEKHQNLSTLKNELAQEGKTLYEVNATQKATLESIAGNDSYAASYARGILRVLNGGDAVYREPMPYVASNMMLRKAPKKVNKTTDLQVLSMLPNPAHDYLQVHYATEETNLVLMIFDVQGRTILATEANSTVGDFTIPVADWVAGAYRVVLSTNGRTIATQSIIKQ